MGGGIELLLKRRFELLKNKGDDADMFEKIGTVEGKNTWGRISTTIDVQDNSFYLLKSDYDNILIVVNVRNGKYSCLGTSDIVTNGGVTSNNYTLTGSTITLPILAIATTGITASISFEVYKLK